MFFFCEHPQKCLNNHKHDCGHLRKEEEEEDQDQDLSGCAHNLVETVCPSIAVHMDRIKK